MTATVTESAIRAACMAAARQGDRAALALARSALADLFEEQGRPEAAAARAGAWQTTAPGTRVVTVGRDGAKTANTGGSYSVAVWTTKVYIATPRKRDGALVWRLIRSVPADSTSGRAVSGPMEARARSWAEAHGLEYVDDVRAWQLCP